MEPPMSDLEVAIAQAYEQGQRDALAGAVARVEALNVFVTPGGTETLLRSQAIAAIMGEGA